MKPHYGKATLGRLTRSGAVMLLVLTLLLMAAWNTGENLLYIIFGGVFGMFFLSILAARWSLRRMAVKRVAPYAVFRGETFAYAVDIENHKRFIPAISLRLAQEGKGRAYVLRVPAGSRAVASVEFSFLKRGAFLLPPCELVTAFPFGFLELRRRYVDAVEVLVYPRIRPVRLSAIDRLSSAQFAPSLMTGEGDEFYSLREYVHGDDLRRVAWRVSARLGVWMVREMGMGQAKTMVLVFDARRFNAPDFEERFEDGVELAASLMVSLLNRQYSVGMVAPGLEIACGKGVAQERRLLDCMARIAPVEPESHGDFDERVRRLGAESTRVVCVSPNPETWGGTSGSGRVPVLDPEAVVHG